MLSSVTGLASAAQASWGSVVLSWETSPAQPVTPYRAIAEWWSVVCQHEITQRRKKKKSVASMMSHLVCWRACPAPERLLLVVCSVHDHSLRTDRSFDPADDPSVG